ncbi:MAG: tryptophan--tRNA ligase, partial [Parcubacteria group bacterium]|nr:tryptophan--tRNA ligase [Parcubacteria group bacterium]
NLHLGNYLGAIKNWVELQKNNQCYFCIVDHHAITVPQDPQTLRSKILETAKIYLGCGIYPAVGGMNPSKSVIFVQSHVPEHTELAWILGTLTKVSEMQLMTQFKEKAQKQPKNINMGLFSYPILMAADILLYGSELVPVGQDQTQHLELTRRLAERFNKKFGQTFIIPKQMTQKIGARIMALDDPSQKMSKSSKNPKNYIALLDEPDEIRKKIQSAVTDSGSEIYYDKEKKPGVSNLMEIYHLLEGSDFEAITNRYQGKNYSQFKTELAEIVIQFLKPIQEKILGYDDKTILSILWEGSQKAHEKASAKLKEVKEKIGYL